MNMTALCRSLDSLLAETHGLYPLSHDTVIHRAVNQTVFEASRVYGIEGGKYVAYILSFRFLKDGVDIGSMRLEILSHSSARVHFTMTSITDSIPAVSKFLKREFNETELPILAVNKLTLLSRIPGRFSRDKEVVVDLQPTAQVVNVVREILPVFDRVARVLSAPRTLHIPERK